MTAFPGAGLRQGLFATGAAIAAIATASPALAQTRSFNVPEQAAGRGIPTFARQAGIQLLASGNAVRGRRTNAVRGAMSVEEGLRRLLAGTGLEASPDSGGTGIITIRAAEGVAPSGEGEAGGAAADSGSAGSGSTGEIFVTGTRLRQGGQTSPIIEVTREAIERSGFTSAGDVVRGLPQSFGGGMNANVVGAGGTANTPSVSGASSANLRGLGSESTLTLVNGHRLATSDLFNAVDVSIIPVAAIERVDVLLDGASAIYGSDAIAGVVNFVMRKDYEGAELRATVGTATDGGATLQQYDATFGRRWNGGGLLLAYEHSNQQEIVGRQRAYIGPQSADTFLIPRTNRNSIFFIADQAFGPAVELFVQGLYTRRSAFSVRNDAATAGRIFHTDADVEQYGLTAGAHIDLSSNWRATIATTLARNATDAPQTEFRNGVNIPAGSGQQRYTNRLWQVEAALSGTLIELPSGPVELAVGAEYRRESLDAFNAQGATVFASFSPVRKSESAYAELSIPIVPPSGDRAGLNSFLVTFAGRYDHYSDVGTSVVPKIGVLYRPFPGLSLRGSWSRSFHAPSFTQLYAAQTSFLFPLPDPQSATGTSIALIANGGNRALEPEESEVRTINVEYAPHRVSGLRIGGTYYNIDYRNRIAFPGGSLFQALADPAYASLITRNPSADLQAAIIAGGTFLNLSGQPYNPATVAAFADRRYANIAVQRARGFDAYGSYDFDTRIGQLGVSANLTFLDLIERPFPTTPVRQVSGNVFSPPDFRARGGLTWRRDGWGAAAFLNHTAALLDQGRVPPADSQSFTTVDLQLSYRFGSVGVLNDLRINLSAQNLFDRHPPRVTAFPGQLGINYDSTNASAIGRFVTFGLIKAF